MWIFRQLLPSVSLVALSPWLVFAHASYERKIVDYLGPVDAHAKAIGDINGDGHLDLVVAGTEGEIVWYEYPSWKRWSVVTRGGGWSNDIEPADVDRDGHLDLVVSDYYQHDRLLWFKNPGASGGAWTEHIIGSPRAHDIEVSDLDGDGDVDVVTRIQGEHGGVIRIWRQDGLDSWTLRTITCPTGEGLHVADVDRDGDDDIVIGGWWFENAGDIVNGPWTATHFAVAWTHAEGLPWVGDINGDSRPDVAIVPSESVGQVCRIAWYEAPEYPKAANWAEHVVDAPIECVHHSLALADVDQDGDLDLITAQMHQGADPDAVLIYVNADALGMRWSRRVVDTRGSHNLQVADIGGDGDIDFFGTNWEDDSKVVLWEQVGSPQLPARALDRWAYMTLDGGRVGQWFGLDAYDVDGDGDLDLASGPYLYMNPGRDMTERWQRRNLPVAADAVLFLDVDGDPYPDLIAAALPDVYWLEATDAKGEHWHATRVAEVPETRHGNGQGFRVAEVVGGGRPEVLLSTGDGIRYLEVSHRPSEGHWPVTRVNSPGSEEGFAVGDVDGDGRADIAAPVSKASVEVRWWRNPAQAGSDWSEFRIGVVPAPTIDRVELADLNSDGRADVVVSTANGDNDGVFWFENRERPEATRWRRHRIANLASPNSLSVVDLDDDGDSDVVVAEHTGDLRVFVFENEGSAESWRSHLVGSGRESHLGARPFDLDGDGDLDVVSIAWYRSQEMHLWRNDSTHWRGGILKEAVVDINEALRHFLARVERCVRRWVDGD